ncbi:Fic family protein [Aeromicrobium tamlense]|uniref:Fic family protein n=1 Tax=Aeromicrobium tamlense TaxID=375541 RepID=A0A8I0FZ06_9ACTN|nr:Fic family protein [Aeromicrobium tamlense]MBD1269944.1 Fic family protein [Aeromicrobium tamlense]NYI39399.1 Fic family protein [Aeromicrobium tamlense]
MAPLDALTLGWEQLAWQPSVPVEPTDRRRAAVVGRPYRAAVPPPIADLEFDLDAGVAARSEDARAAITRFDADLSALFDGEFAPLSAVLLRTESASSSQIENITVGAKALSLADVGLAKFGSNAKLVQANVEAMNRALEFTGALTPELVLSIHEALMHDQDQADPGRFREQQVWIGGTDYSPHEAEFVPPRHSRIQDSIQDLCAFSERTTLPLLAHAAIAHAQFETIHPFNDGNGRVGRALVHVMLRNGGATTRTTVPVSAGLLADTDAYYAALTAYRNGDPNPIVAEFSRAAFAAVSNGQELAADLKALHDRWRDNLQARKDAVAWRVLPYLLRQPSVTSKLIQTTMQVTQPAADNALRQLQEAGALSKPKNVHGEGATRNVVWQATEVLAALDRFGDRARRNPRSA